MEMTPRQIAAFLHFADRDDAISEARFISHLRLAFGGEAEDVTKYLKTLVPE